MIIIIVSAVFSSFSFFAQRVLKIYTNLLSKSFAKNVEYADEIYMVMNSIESAMIHFELDRAKSINNKLIELLLNTLPYEYTHQLMDKDLHFSSNKNNSEKLN